MQDNNIFIMGLDVSVFNNLKKSNDEEGNVFIHVISESWKHKVKNFEYETWYKGEQAPAGVSYAYSSHSRFREFLIQIIDRNDLLDSDGRIRWNILDNHSEIPFYDLIDFADNEGCLDFEVSKKLYSDFEKYQTVAKEKLSEGWFERYEDWMNIFKHASNNGVVDFH